MAVNSHQPTLLSVIILFVRLSRLYNQDVPVLDFVVLSVVVLVVPTQVFVVREVGRIWRLAMEPGRGHKSLEKYSEASERQRTIPTPPTPTHRG